MTQFQIQTPQTALQVPRTMMQTTPQVFMIRVLLTRKNRQQNKDRLGG
jgi:hypothetical protein